MTSGIKLPGFKLTADGKIEKDLKAAEAKLDVSTRIKRKHSPKVKFKRGGK